MRVRLLGTQPYEPVWQAMRALTDQRQADTPDELWLLQHAPVFTQGQAGKAEHVLAPGSIPVVQVDRGGQVTYHGPGQLMGYLLLDVARRQMGVRALVSAIEIYLVDLLAQWGIEANARPDAPGVYVQGRKVASLGLRIRRGCSLHGFALNVDMDLEPFSRINPCGYAGMQMCQVSGFRPDLSFDAVQAQVLATLPAHLGYHVADLSTQLPECIV